MRFSRLGKANVATLMLMSLFSPLQAQAFGCDEPFVRPNYISRAKICATGEYVYDAYAPKTKILCEEMEIDHLISLRQAWESGICGSELKNLANDPLNLKPTFWRTNRVKGRMPPMDFAKQLDERTAKIVENDAIAVMKKYGIISRREIIEQRFSAQLSRMKVVTIPYSSLAIKSGRFTFKSSGGKTAIFFGKRIVGTVTIVGGVYAAAEISAWSYRHLFIPSRSQATHDRAAEFKRIIDDFE